MGSAACSDGVGCSVAARRRNLSFIFKLIDAEDLEPVRFTCLHLCPPPVHMHSAELHEELCRRPAMLAHTCSLCARLTQPAPTHPPPMFCAAAPSPVRSTALARFACILHNSLPKARVAPLQLSSRVGGVRIPPYFMMGAPQVGPQLDSYLLCRRRRRQKWATSDAVAYAYNTAVVWF